MTDQAACPCETFVHPATISNPPGRDHIAVRAGDFVSFRHALLRALPGETRLGAWRPTATGDLGLQMLEWWAYVADILSFYNEVRANEAYLRTAVLPESVRALIRLLGYRPRPGIGAKATLAALSSAARPFVLPAGFQVQSRPGPGRQPQVFELGADVTVRPGGSIPADPSPATALLSGSSVLLEGTGSGLKADDRLLLLPRAWPKSKGAALVTVQGTAVEVDPRGNRNTRVTFQGSAPSLPGATAAGYRLVKPVLAGGLWTYATGTTPVIGSTFAHLAGLVRQLHVNDPVLFEGTNLQPSPVNVDAIQEVVWYANPGDPDDPTVPPAGTAVPIPHTRLTFSPGLSGDWQTGRASVTVTYGWQDVGELIASPASGLPTGGGAITLSAVGAGFPAGDRPALIEDAIGDGFEATASVGVASTSSLSLTDLPSPVPPLTPPLDVLLNLLQVTRGQSVAGEVLGSGDPTQANQEFVLQKSPLTYLLSANAAAPASYESTLAVRVDGVEWQEVESFYAQRPDARVFVTREDDHQETHVTFGDGVNGARLPLGTGNVVADYRYGSGREAPAVGTLNVILKPRPGLRALRNPVAAGGGADPDPQAQVRKYAPRSVLTFGRAVSADDYEVIAAQTPGVARARAYFRWDPGHQRAVGTVYVGDDAGAVAAAKIALGRAIDPNRPATVVQATDVPVSLGLTVLVSPGRVPAEVAAAARAALLDPDTGLFGANVVRIGGRIYDSQVDQALCRVPGVEAVHALKFGSVDPSGAVIPDPAAWHDPGEGCFHRLADANLDIDWEVAPGA